MWNGTQQERLSEEYEDHAGNHGIPHETIRTADDQVTRWIPRREGALSLGREQEYGAREESETDQ